MDTQLVTVGNNWKIVATSAVLFFVENIGNAGIEYVFRAADPSATFTTPHTLNPGEIITRDAGTGVMRARTMQTNVAVQLAVTTWAAA